MFIKKPKIKKEIWIFGSWSGRYYNDNAKYLFEYVHKNKPEIRPIWLTNKKKVFEELTRNEKECYMFYSPKGILYSLIASVLIVTDSWGDIPITSYFFPKRKKIIQLWHGTLLRKVDLKAGNIFKKIRRNLFIKHLGREYDLVISGSKKNGGIFQKLFNTENIVVTGQPRIDGIYNYKGLLKDIYKNKKIIMYLPTWRDNSYKLFNKKNKFSFNKINTFLRNQKAILIVKIHPYDLHKYSSLPKGDNIIFTTDMEDIYMYLSDVDILLSDYSSVFFDFLILNRPIIFAPFDIMQYEKQNGFYYNYSGITPGPKVYDWDEIMLWIKKFLNDKDEYGLVRKKIGKEFNEFRDNNNTVRTFNVIHSMKNVK